MKKIILIFALAPLMMFAQTKKTKIVRRICAGGASAKAVPVQRSKNKRVALEAGVGLI